MNIFYADDGGDDVVAAGDGGWNCRKDRRSGCFHRYSCRGVVATAIDAAYSSWAASSTFHSKSSRHEKVSLPQLPSMI